MRLALVSDAWEPQVNGVVRTLTAVTEQLRGAGHEVLTVTPDRFRTMPCPSYPEIRLALFPGRALAAALDRFSPDAIHVATEGPLGLAARRYCRRRRIAFTSSYHTRFPEYLRARGRVPPSWTHVAQRWFHGAAAGTLVPSESMRQLLAARGYRRLVHWPRGVDTRLFRPRPRPSPGSALDLPRPVWLSVGRLAVEKNLEAFLGLDLPGTKLVVGDGPRRPLQARRYPQARFVGAKAGEDLARHYAAADVFVFPSRTDTFGLVMLEALACGIPVAAYPVPGPLDVIGHAPVGCLDGDLGRAARAALRLSPAACRAFAQARSWDVCAQQFLAALVPVCQGPVPVCRGMNPAVVPAGGDRTDLEGLRSRG